MGRLAVSMSVSVDGFIDSAAHSLEWVRIDEDLHQAFNDEARRMRAFLYGRRMWEVMEAYWPTGDSDPDATPAMVEFAQLWQATPKVVFSRSLESVGHGARLVRGDVVEEVRRLKAEPGDLGIGGATVTAPLIAAGLVDDLRLYVNPVVLGAGTRFFPPLAAPVELRLAETRTFASGVVLLRYESG